jgi:hypothetical protein
MLHSSRAFFRLKTRSSGRAAALVCTRHYGTEEVGGDGAVPAVATGADRCCGGNASGVAQQTQPTAAASPPAAPAEGVVVRIPAPCAHGAELQQSSSGSCDSFAAARPTSEPAWSTALARLRP